MPIRYIGVRCPSRQHFVEIGRYDVEHPASPLGASRTVDHATWCFCEQCNVRFTYEQRDVMHCNSLDGKDAEYQDER